MKRKILFILLAMTTSFAFAQTGHLMQGIGAFNMSMGGASTGQPLDIEGALQWNPASISVFNHKIISFDVGLMASSPTIYSTVPTQTGTYISGSTEDDKGISPLPALAMVFGKENSKHTFGVSVFGVSGFGVTFPESTTNPINFPQSMGGFGRLESNYMLLQVGFTYAYQISDNFSVGIEPTIDYASLKVNPNPLASPSQTLGYPNSDNASAFGFGGQIGVFYRSDFGFKMGVSYKTEQYFSDLTFSNTYLDGSPAPENKFKMNFPSIFSVGVGYSTDKFDFALDYRRIFYENTDGFENTGWTETGAVAGFGWKNISVLSVGLQLKLINKLPFRFGYTYNDNPIDSDVAMYSVEAPAVVKNAFQFGFGYIVNKHITINAAFHHGTSSGKTSGPLLNPSMVSSTNPYGAIPGSDVSYDMTTNMVMFGFSYTFD
ncbi:outer membrane protein transport protein [Candidatus Sulfidibacterium hydrothermale]|uniref:OmpP1/FadL family transporter n=1 Tax=Candidatus Sulfidibacterium hydrothermale TaxID=2875962 RepID=UPI001F0AAF61|nr:outer membrane protein transport protein [Candidatus Sulfidibacterium hydrothermale]UBM62577.1 outer membrane protein transport protein [Candidatus Sulfidibacterium hydrothermale]